MEPNSLDKIINLKKEKLNSLKNELNINDLKNKIDKFDKFFDFKKSIEKNFSLGKISLIAEIKKASPSAGIIIENYNPVDIASTYKKNNATCLSVLTEENFFHGSLDHINEIKNRNFSPSFDKVEQEKEVKENPDRNYTLSLPFTSNRCEKIRKGH